MEEEDLHKCNHKSVSILDGDLSHIDTVQVS